MNLRSVCEGRQGDGLRLYVPVAETGHAFRVEKFN